MDDENTIEIDFSTKIPKHLKVAKGLSDAMKHRIARSIKDNEVKIQNKKKSKSKTNISDIKVNTAIEILEDRSKFDRSVTRDELLHILDDDNKYLSAFVLKIRKAATDKNMILEKKGQKYKLIC